MAIKQEQHIIKGLQRDLARSKFNPEFAFDARNIRITARENNTLLSVTNEKGTKELILKSPSGEVISVEGTLIGYNVLNEYLTLFSKGDTDNIYRLENKEDYFETVLLFSGNLNFDVKHPIESIGVYENDNIKKVYWVDGVNQPRVINIAVKDTYIRNTFDFVLPFNLPEVSISKIDNLSGNFSSGTLQYAISYYNKYGQETNLIYVSDLQYLSYKDRGGSPEDLIKTSFNINIKNIDTSFDFIRIYSILRTSINATPTVHIVTDIKISNSEINITDLNNTGESVDPSILLYIGGRLISASTITQKDNTLFLGNIELKDKYISKENKDLIKSNSSVEFVYRTVDIKEEDSYYPYNIQLNNSSSKIKTFKGGETYRIGVQFIDKTGNYSEPIYLGDFKNTLYSKIENTKYYYPEVKATVYNPFAEDNYIGLRLLMVEPSLSDRSIVAQGILCPTLFNPIDRNNNSPYSISSWFCRPNNYKDAYNDNINKEMEFRHYFSIHEEVQGGNSILSIPIYSIGLMAYQTLTLHYKFISNEFGELYYYMIEATSGDTSKTVTSGTSVSYEAAYNNLVKWMDESYIPSQDEWETAFPEEKNITVGNVALNTGYINAAFSKYSMNYYVDNSILTFHSPDIDSISSLKNSDLKLRIIGYTELESTLSDYSIQSTIGRALSSKVLDYDFSGKNNYSGFNIYKPLYYDSYKDKDNEFTYYYVYPWHRNGSLNNDGIPSGDETRTALLQNKIISNLRYFNSTKYFNNPWEAYQDNNINTGITKVQVFDSDEMSLIKIPKPLNSILDTDINYYGNVDIVLTPYLQDTNSGYELYNSGLSFEGGIDLNNPDVVLDSEVGKDAVSIKFKSTPHAVFAFNWTKDNKLNILPSLNSEDNMIGVDINSLPLWYKDDYIVILNYIVDTVSDVPEPIENQLAYERISKTFKRYKNSEWLPEIGYPNYSLIYYNVIYKSVPVSSEEGTVYELEKRQFINDSNIIEGNYTTSKSYLYVAELYKDISDDTIYGGKEDYSLQQNKWIPISDIQNNSGSNIEIHGTEGDTYYQRYDCLKTYPYTYEDQNSIVDICSFMVETHNNIDGRYDRNRGQQNNLNANPTNFNLFNPVYNQSNNFFNYRILDDSYNLNVFKNQITWTKEKTLGESIDSWSNITLASTLDLDGDKGEVVSLNTFNNEIYCFQKQGLSNILFNSRVQIPSSDGVPIEITNGLKVGGKRYISNTIGCTNKWSIAESPSGLYFIDNETNSLYLFNGQIQSLSDKLGFRQWIGENNSHDKWDPVNYNNFRTFYDKNNDDVYFINKNECLCYSELLGQFTSFMSYEKVPAMFNIGSEFYSFNKGKLWQNFEGEYNMFYGEFKPYSITVIANSDEPYDKIFNTVEFRSDSWDGDTLINTQTFDTLDVWNEYQSGTSTLVNVKGKPSPLKKKFRVWRANIPRDNSNHRDRIRNTWAYIKLSMNTPNTWKTEFHDMTIYYFV